MKRNRLVPALAIVGDHGRQVRWPNLVSDPKAADYLLLSLHRTSKRLPIAALIESLESEGGQYGYFDSSEIGISMFHGGAIVRRDIYDKARLKPELDAIGLAKTWILSHTRVQSSKASWDVPYLPKASNNLAQLESALREATSMIAWLKKNGSSEDVDQMAAHTFRVIAMPYVLAVPDEPVLYFGKLKLMLLALPYDFSRNLSSDIDNVLHAVRTASRAESLRFLSVL